MKKKYNAVLLGVLLSLLTLITAEFMATTFGLYEKDIKGKLIMEALEHTKDITISGHDMEDDINRKVFKDSAEAKKTAKKAWVYLKRAHVHGEGMGAISLVLILLLVHTQIKPIFKKVFSLMIGLGSFIYPLCILYAGIFMVDKGKLVAKGDVHLLAVSSVSLYLCGLFAIFFMIIIYYLKIEKINDYFFEK